jgi:3-(3-hydroxy-phenyl)propionate hydroxylase
VDTPTAVYTLQTDWLVVADGARSPVRRMMGLDIDGKVFQDRFLIADVVMKARPFRRRGRALVLVRPALPPRAKRAAAPRGRQRLAHRLPARLGRRPRAEKLPERVSPRIARHAGRRREFELEWVSVYTFQCRRMDSFRHGRVLFAGDAAHQVSPFGARGANSGIQDTDNLAWKLKLVIDGLAPEALLDTYSERACGRGRREPAELHPLHRLHHAQEPDLSWTFRNAVLGLAREYPFARALVNSGRLSVPT